jgi:hypothetical protein
LLFKLSGRVLLNFLARSVVRSPTFRSRSITFFAALASLKKLSLASACDRNQTANQHDMSTGMGGPKIMERVTPPRITSIILAWP